MYKKFNNLPRILQIILLLIPVCNWVTEVVVRWSAFGGKKTIFRFIIALLVTVFGIVFGWVDVIWCLLFKHLIFAS